MKHIGLLFPNQLFLNHEIFQQCEEIYLIEEDLYFKEFNFHKVKLAFQRASMRSYFEIMASRNDAQWYYIDQGQKSSDIREFLTMIRNENPLTIHFIDPTDEWLRRRIIKGIGKSIEYKEYENPLFLNTRDDLAHFFKKDKKSFFQTTFYKQERKKRGILIEGKDQPMGGKWTFDVENRKKYPKNATPPAMRFPDSNEHWNEAIEYVEQYFYENIGKVNDQPRYPYNHQQAQEWFDEFLNIRFHLFGDYEDALVKDEWALHHSILSPLLNTGLLSVDYVVEKSLDYAAKYDIPLNSLEGFIRQIIGWREFIRGMYEVKGNYSRTKNFWGFTRKIPGSFYDGTTGIEPLDQTIKKVIDTGYCHHIERLMILGNFMLLCEFDPDEVYRWFMELFIDAYDWVMVPNVYGMSQFADGGLFATKPYISGSNYIIKMSNYSKGHWQQKWDGLFWRFMDKHRNFFLGNPRLGMLVRTFDKMNIDKKTAHLSNGEAFLQSLDES